MTLLKAIEVLLLDVTCEFEGNAKDLEDAIKLGIEALKRVQACREPEGGSPLPPLAGETPE